MSVLVTIERVLLNETSSRLVEFRLKFGISLGNCAEGLTFPIPFANGADIVGLGVEAEKLGYDSVWANDHITTQLYVKKLWGKSPNYYEPLMILSYIASRTKRITLGTGVIVLPNRNLPILAKEVSTLDVLSGGRMILGIGSGAYKEEFEAMHPGLSIGERSRVFEESLEGLCSLLTQSTASYDGKYVKFKEIELFPKPEQHPFPIYIGGNYHKSFERVSKYARGWLPGMLTPDEISSMLSQLRASCQRHGRSLSEIDVAPQLTACVGKTSQEAIKKFKDSAWYKHLESLRTSTLRGKGESDLTTRGLIGSVDEVIDKIEKYIDVGVTSFPHLKFPANRFEEEKRGIEFFAKEVMPSFR